MNRNNWTIDSQILKNAINEIILSCKIAWEKGFMSGWSGNASIRIGNGQMLLTASGSAKGFLSIDDCLLVNLAQDTVYTGKKRPSSEYGIHQAIYNIMPACKAILHTHPKNMQALNLVLNNHNCNDKMPDLFLNINLYEADIWRKRLMVAQAAQPGSNELANNVAQQLTSTDMQELPCAIWLTNHGLFAMASSMQEALCLTEEFEHLASVQLLTLHANYQKIK